MKRKPSFSLKLIGLVSIFCFSVAAQADRQPDYEREARLADQIVDDIFDGEAVWLKANDHDFLTIYTPNEDEKPKGTVILLHGRGYHPEWPEVMAPLRVDLVEAGWSTLAVQMPVLEKGKKYLDYIPLFDFAHARIEAAIAYAKTQANANGSSGPIVLAAHSCGAHMANDWLNHNDDSSIDGYIIMGAGATDYRQVLQTPFPFARMQVPILDLYGEFEFPRPMEMRAERQALMNQAGHNASAQEMLPEADHYFHESGDTLTEAVATWLNKTDFTKRLP